MRLKIQHFPRKGSSAGRERTFKGIFSFSEEFKTLMMRCECEGGKVEVIVLGRSHSIVINYSIALVGEEAIRLFNVRLQFTYRLGINRRCNKNLKCSAGFFTVLR